MTPDGKYIFAVDFDGTLMKGNTWPDVDGIVDIDLIVYLLNKCVENRASSCSDTACCHTDNDTG